MIKIDSAYLKELEALQVPEEKKSIEFHDSELRGFRVRKNYGGTISFLVAWRMGKGKREEVVVGKYPKMSISNARICATVMLAEKLKNRKASAVGEDNMENIILGNKKISVTKEDADILTSFGGERGAASDAEAAPFKPKRKKGMFKAAAESEPPAEPVSTEDKIIAFMSPVAQACIALHKIGTQRDAIFRKDVLEKIQKEYGDKAVLEASKDYLEAFKSSSKDLMEFEKIDSVRDANFVLRSWIEG